MTSVQTFAANIEQARQLALAILAATNDHLGRSPESVDWSDVGDSARLASSLSEICETLNIRPA